MAAGSDLSYRVKGADDAARALARVREAAREADGLRRLGEDRVEVSRGVVKVATGGLRGTIRADLAGDTLTLAAGDESHTYAGVLDSGAPSRGIDGDQFLTGPATDSDAAAQHIEQDLAGVIRRL